MEEQTAPEVRRPRWVRAAVAAFVAFELAAAGLLVATRAPGPADRTDRPAAEAPAHTRPTPASPYGAADAYADRRAAEVTTLLERRAAAIRTRDRRAFTATLDPRATRFVQKQLAMFDALAEVPIGTWRYDVAEDGDVPPESPYLAKYDTEAWSPSAVLRYQLKGYDDTPTAVPQYFTFVRRGGRWLTASDDDFGKDADRVTGREVWDFGPVRVVRGTRSLVLGHPGQAALLREVARLADAAVPRVTAVWGTGWSRRPVVVVPATQRELATILGDAGDLSRIAAVAIAELPGDTGDRPVGNRIIVNPPNFRRLGAHGRRVVVTHEVTHVATREATGPGVPTWLVEGFADYVGYLGTGLGPKAICQELAADLRAGRKLTALPKDTEFAGSNPRLAQAYEAAWLAVRLVVERTGREGLLRFYRAIRTAPGPDPVRTAMRTALGTAPETFTAAWRTYVRQQLT